MVTLAVSDSMEKQPASTARTVNRPDSVTPIELVVAPLLQTKLAPVVAVKVTISGSQTVTGPAGEMVGIAGTGRMLTVLDPEASDVQPCSTNLTVNVPAFRTNIRFEVSPFDQILPFAALEIRATESPWQMDTSAAGEVMLGATGFGSTVTCTGVDVAEEQPVAPT